MKSVTACSTSSDPARAFDLELEHADLPLRGDSIHLRGERPAAAADELDVLEEGALLDPGHELLFAEKPVLAAVLLARALGARRGGDGDLGGQGVLEEPLDQRFAGPARAGDDEDGSGLAVEEANELGALDVGEAAYCLRLADPH